MSNFQSLMRRADTMRRIETNYLHEAWWTGYIKGLRRAHHGERFGTQAEHELFLSTSESTDPSRAALGRGYRAGLTLEPHNPDGYCPRCERIVPLIDNGETCAVCKLVL